MLSTPRHSLSFGIISAGTFPSTTIMSVDSSCPLESSTIACLTEIPDS
jgi:hypothetical protein